MNKSEYQEYLKTDHWKRMRTAAQVAAGDRCQVCNATGELHVHHRTYDRIGRELPYDLICLCRVCHEKAHGKTQIHEAMPIEAALRGIDMAKSLDGVALVQFLEIHGIWLRAKDDGKIAFWWEADKRPHSWLIACIAFRKNDILDAMRRLDSCKKEEAMK